MHMLFAQQSENIDCILLDLTMPRMDGEETHEELRKICADVPVVLSSGYIQSELQTRFAGKGINAFIQKPYELEQLVTVVNRAIRA